jgi:hypothetical protein
VLALLTSLLMVLACGGGDITLPPTGNGTLSVSADASATSAVTVVVVVTGPGISTPLTFNLTITNGVVTGTVTIPAGSSRTITMHAYDAGGIETHQGTMTVNISAGGNPTASLLLTPLTGENPITATFGSFAVTVTPSPATVAVGATAALTAALTWNGNPITGTCIWATSNPGIATVTTSGVVTGVGAGQTAIVATFQGVAGSSTVTVTGP